VTKNKQTKSSAIANGLHITSTLHWRLQSLKITPFDRTHTTS